MGRIIDDVFDSQFQAALDLIAGLYPDGDKYKNFRAQNYRFDIGGKDHALISDTNKGLIVIRNAESAFYVKLLLIRSNADQKDLLSIFKEIKDLKQNRLNSKPLCAKLNRRCPIFRSFRALFDALPNNWQSRLGDNVNVVSPIDNTIIRHEGQSWNLGKIDAYTANYIPSMENGDSLVR